MDGSCLVSDYVDDDDDDEEVDTHRHPASGRQSAANRLPSLEVLKFSGIATRRGGGFEHVAEWVADNDDNVAFGLLTSI